MGADMKISQIDYMCKVKCQFYGRMHYPGQVYQFVSSLQVPEKHFDKLGPHVAKVSIEAQISELRERVVRLENGKVKVMKGKEVKDEEIS